MFDFYVIIALFCVSALLLILYLRNKNILWEIRIANLKRDMEVNDLLCWFLKTASVLENEAEFKVQIQILVTKNFFGVFNEDFEEYFPELFQKIEDIIEQWRDCVRNNSLADSLDFDEFDPRHLFNDLWEKRFILSREKISEVTGF